MRAKVGTGIHIAYFLLLICIKSSIGIDDSTSSNYVNKLENQSFFLRSNINNILTPKEFLKSETEENYSMEQSRAKINFRLITRTMDKLLLKKRIPWGTLYHDSKQDSTLIRGTDMKCKEMPKDQFANDLLRLMFPEIYQDPKVAPEHVVGAARIIFFVLQHRKEFTLKDTGKFQPRVRNIPAYLYKFKYTLNDQLDFSIYFSKSDIDSDNKYTALPIQIMIENLTREEIIIINYSEIELINEKGSQIEQESSEQPIQFDQFAFEPVSGCSKVLSPAKEENIFQERSGDSVKFSFRAEVEIRLLIEEKYSDFKIKAFVAYDKRLDSMVYDLIGSETQSTREVTGVRKQLFNFKLNRMYHIVERVSGSDNFIDKILDLNDRNTAESDKDALNGRTGSSQCAVTKIFNQNELSPKDRQVFSIGQLLLGSDKFVYLGRASVRGIRALVYEVNGANLIPIWLDQPIEVRQLDGTFKTRIPFVRPKTKLNTIAYFGNEDSEYKLLAIELLQVDELNEDAIYDRQMIHVYDFDWNIEHKSPDGMPIESFFTLEEYCSNNLGKNEYGRIELLLESSDSSIPIGDGSSQLEIGPIRNLAIQASLQESFGLPATMLFDMESNLIRKKGPNSLLMSVNFRVAEHYDDLVQLNFLGYGEPFLVYRQKRIQMIVRSFQACFFQAAHVRRVGVFFGYDPVKRVCSIDTVPVKADYDEGGRPPAFIIFKNGDESSITGLKLEIYRTVHLEQLTHASTSNGISNTWLEFMLKPENRMKLLGSELIFRDMFADSSKPLSSRNSMTIKFKVIDSRFNLNSLKPSRMGPQEDEQVSEKALRNGKLAGFGLAQNSEQFVKLVEPSDEKLAMSQDQCRASCLADFACKAFSICLLNNDYKCLTTEVDLFRLGQLGQKLREIYTKKSNSSQSHTIEINFGKANSIKLVRHPNCDLIEKNYLELFKGPQAIQHRLLTNRVHPVDSSAECAQLCFKRNLDLIEGDLKKFSGDYSSNQVSGQLLLNRRGLSKAACRSFSYLDLAGISLLGPEMASQFEIRISAGDLEQKLVPLGYCIIGDQVENVEKLAQVDKESVKDDPKFDVYYFNYVHLYEKQSGVKMYGSVMSTKEFQAYKTIKKFSTSFFPQQSSSSELEQSVDTVSAFMASGANVQEELLGDEFKCAKLCFLQTAGPWPACRSFDVSIELENGTYVSKCYLNSLTLSAANRIEADGNSGKTLVDYSRGASSSLVAQKWHFEPRGGSALEESQIEEELKLGELDDLIGLVRGRFNQHRVNAFGISLIVLFGISRPPAGH